MRPRGVLFDYAGTLVEEVSVDLRTGNEWVLSRAAFRPNHVTLDNVLERARRIAVDVAGRRDHVHLETPWRTLARLIYDYYGVRFDVPMEELELGFWKASVQTRPIRGALQALEALRRAQIPAAVVSNTSFGERVITYELAKHGLAGHLEFVMASADYTVRKPNVLLFEIAAARLGLHPVDIWFAGDRLGTDIVGAKDAGMTAVWFNPNNRQESSHPADVVVSDWDDFTRRVRAAGTASARVSVDP